jgi:membrane-associated protein
VDAFGALAAALPALGPGFLDPQTLISSLGSIAFWVVLFIIFAECGLLVGFFLPGDSLLFITGMLLAGPLTNAGDGSTEPFIQVNIVLAVILLVIAAFLGNVVGYQIGAAAGPALFRRPDSRLFKQSYVDKTQAFFDRYGSRAIVLARFVPIVRTFITAVAGAGRMDRRRFLVASAVGAVLWAGLVTVAGYFLGRIDIVRDNIEKVLILIVVISILPMIVEYVRHRRQAARS